MTHVLIPHQKMALKNGGTSYVISGTACVIGSTTTTIKTQNGVARETTTGCAITTVRGREVVTKTSRAITAATSQAITTAKKRAVIAKESADIVWRRVARKVVRKSKSLPKLPPIARQKQLLVTIGNKAISNFRKNNKKKNNRESENCGEDFGDGGLWQRTILMGDKCQPLDFSGVIYYDSDGKRMSELPTKSPRRFPSNVHDESASNSGEIMT